MANLSDVIAYAGFDTSNVTDIPSITTNTSEWFVYPIKISWRTNVAPSWDTVRTELRWFFLLHAYGFACSFFILAFYAFFSILNIRSLITSRPFMSTINMFLCLLGMSRAGSLFIDPYNLKETMPLYLGSIIWDVGYPSIISAFSLVQLAFLQLTQLKLGPDKLRSKSCLSLIVTAHFTCVIAFDIVVPFYHSFYIVKHLTETVFLLWGIFLCCTFLYAGYRVMSLLKNMSGILLQKDMGDTQYKGIMQLAMLAPYNNLATSVAAALVPTLLAPKFALSGNEHFSANKDVMHPEASTSKIKQHQSSLKNPQEPPSSVAASTSNNKWVKEETNNGKHIYSRLESSPSTSRQNSALKMTKSQSSGSSNLSSDLTSDVPKLKKNLSWRADDRVAAEMLNKSKLSFKRKKIKEETKDEETAETTLLPQPQPDLANDLTLHAILNHIAYVNRAAQHSESALGPTPEHPTPASRKKQVAMVLRVTYATALFGLVLCLTELFRLYGPYAGILASPRQVRAWPWFCFHTICRAVELAMGCAMANITKQPVTRHHHSYLHHQYTRSIHIKQRESLFM